MQYYAEREGIVDLKEIKIEQSKFNKLFKDAYIYFEEKGYFEVALHGHGSKEKTFIPSAENYFFANGLKDAIPIDKKSWEYDKSTAFTVIEILYKHIIKINMHTNLYGEVTTHYTYDEKEPQKEFREMINQYLRCLDDGYELIDSGTIIRLEEGALGSLVKKDLPKGTEDKTIDKVENAVKNFLKHDSTEGDKLNAVKNLIDLLEPYRKALKDITDKDHDTMLFGIANQYGIRHNNVQQKEDYDKKVWYEWMFHYYLATLHVALRLQLEVN